MYTHLHEDDHTAAEVDGKHNTFRREEEEEEAEEEVRRRLVQCSQRTQHSTALLNVLEPIEAIERITYLLR